MKQVDRHGKYLGIPTVMGRSKKAIFSALTDRIWKKLQGWKESLLSRAGKEILLKAVIQSIPTYLMAVYKFPESVINEISSAMARFFWGKKGTKRKIHWKNWNIMCSPKPFGGMGFKDLRIFNDALLGRQAWRLINLENSLLGRVMKAKYFPHSNFLEASLGYAGSYSWRSIWSSKALVKEGTIWRIGNGTRVNIWRDPWISDEEGRFISSPEVESVKQVSDLIDLSVMEWNLEKITSLFNERDQKCILSIPLSGRSPSDVMSWAYSNDGLYSTKTSYMLGKGCNLNDLHMAWMEIWEMEVPPKVRHFLWRLCTETLPSKSLLKRRHLLEETGCPRCTSEEETSRHAIFDCHHVKDLWEISGCRVVLGNCSMNFCDMIASWTKIDPRVKQRAAILAWCIWADRNSKVFENKTSPKEIIIARVLRLAEEYGNYSKRIYNAPHLKPVPSANKWYPPPEGVIKLNVDASLAVKGVIGMGVVARDHTGKVLAAAVRRVRAWWSPEIAEGRALLIACKIAKRMGYANIILESDCQVLTQRLSKAAVYLSDFDGVLEDILSFCSVFNSLVWSHVKRRGNSVAHCLAKIVPFGLEQMWENHCPREISHLVTSDILSS